VAGTRVVEGFDRGGGGAHLVDRRVDPVLRAAGIIERVMDLRGYTCGPALGAEHRWGQRAREHEDAGDRSHRGDVLGHAAAVREARGEKAVAQRFDRCRRASHQLGEADRLDERAGLLVVVEDTSVVLVDHKHLVPRRTQPIGGVEDSGAHPEDGMEQRYFGHGLAPPS